MPFNFDVVKGVIRHLLTTGAGILTTKGYIGESDVEALVGALLLIIGLVWSAVDKKNR